MTVLTKTETRRPSAKAETTRPAPFTNGAIPPLENGDRLSRAEFERRYQAHPEIKKAELIEGVVYVASPVRVRRHGAPHSDIIGWLVVYRSATRGVHVADNSTLQLALDNEPQPDVAVWVEGGNAYINAEDYLEGAPELIVEVAGSSASIDLGDKLTAYRRNGVQEYLVLLTHEREVRWFSWRTGEAEEILPDEGGILRSFVLPGLQLHPGYFWQGDMAGVLEVLQQGLATPEHAAFVQQLQQ
jgi:Uma2 family endonuclease